MGIAIEATDEKERVRELIHAVESAVTMWEDLEVVDGEKNILIVEDGAGNQYELKITPVRE